MEACPFVEVINVLNHAILVLIICECICDGLNFGFSYTKLLWPLQHCFALACWQAIKKRTIENDEKRTFPALFIKRPQLIISTRRSWHVVTILSHWKLFLGCFRKLPTIVAEEELQEQYKWNPAFFTDSLMVVPVKPIEMKLSLTRCCKMFKALHCTNLSVEIGLALNDYYETVTTLRGDIRRDDMHMIWAKFS